VVSAPVHTVVEALERAAARSSAGFRFVDEASGVEPFHRYQDVERLSARYGGAMQQLGLRKGDRVALILPDDADFVFSFLGAARAGLVPVPIYPPAGLRKLEGYLDNTLHIVQKSGARIVVTSSAIRKLLGTIQLRAPTLERVVPVEPIRTEDHDLRPERVEPEDICFLQFTSGSTAEPKGVVVTHANVAANQHAFAIEGLRVTPDDSGVSWLPLYHDMGLIGFVLAPIYNLNSITFLPPLLFLKRPARWLQALSRHRGTVSFAPNFAYALCVKRVRDSDMVGLDLSAWRVAGCGAEPIRADSLQRFAERLAPCGFDRRALLPCYGMAESTLAVSFDELGQGVRTETVDGELLAAEGRAVPVALDSAGALPLVNCGKAFSGHEIGVFVPDDEQGSSRLGDRQVGEIRIRGPSVTAGYFEDPEKTRAAFVAGWLRTGDLGYLVDGCLYVCGRRKEVIIVNGRNYYPQDLEWEASRLEGVRKGNVVAFGVQPLGAERERVVVALETSETDPAKRGELGADVRRAVQQALGLTLDDVVALDPGVLPKTSSGKLKRAETRALYEADALVDRTSIRQADPIGVAKELARSQLAYVRDALRGKKKP
jgi:fatty-acyl-CoA synthase